MRTTSPVTAIPGIGKTVAQKLHKLGIEMVEDLLHHLPRRYEDYSRVVEIASARPGTVTIKGEITQVHTRRTQKGRSLTEALIEDDTGSLQAVWFNQPYLARTLPKRQPVYVAGELAFAYNKYALQSPAVEPVSSFPRSAARIVPVYPETEGISSKQLRRWLEHALRVSVADPLPEAVRRQYQLPDKATALRQVHFPGTAEAAETARQRLAFEELFILLWLAREQRQSLQSQKAPSISFDTAAAQQLVGQLPFDLTDSQRGAAWRIIQDLGRSYPMHRLLQGDVGSGKTVVAAIAAATVARAGAQTVLLAPTEVLARQHQQTLQALLEPLSVPVGLLIGSQGSAEKTETKRRLASGELAVCVGTHALLETDVNYQRLALAIVDEQHRFGVKQREHLRSPGGEQPHFLSMTATPIPRSLALTLYGDLDLSRLRELPPGRQPVRTSVTTNRRQLQERMGDLLAAGEQIFVVCPLITESDTLGVASVEQEVTRLQRQFPEASVAGLHGKLPPAQKQEVMQRFHKGDIDLLVATTVVEVGVDVANASAIVIEGAERFGLATLHQLRGRVGRRGQQAYCYLVPSTPQHQTKRLQLLQTYHDGQQLAEQDLQLRGAGELYGQRQHGDLDLRIARLSDIDIIHTAQQAVAETPELPDDSPVREILKRRRD